MKGRHQHPGDSERWPVISNHDQRSKQMQSNRPFGAAPWNPRDPDNLRICERLIEIRNTERAMAEEQGREWRGLGSRQYAYRLKAGGFLFADKTTLTKDHFERVERILVRARRDPRIDLDWKDVSDGRGISHVPAAYWSNSERIQTLAAFASSQMPHDRMEGQLVVPELVVETEGLYNLIYDIADRYGVRPTALQGQSAVRVRWELAQRVGNRWDCGIRVPSKAIRTRVLGVVDYDKQGDEILGAIAADTAAHLRDDGFDPDDCLEVIRVAVTLRQINEHKIPLAEKDGRFVQEAEALPTDVLRAEVEAALRDTLDMEKFARITQKKGVEIRRLVRKVKMLDAH